MAEGKGFVFVGSDGKMVIPSATETEMACKVNMVAMGSRGQIVPRGSWTVEMVEAAYENVIGDRGHVVPCSIKTFQD